MFLTDSRTETFVNGLGVKWRYTNDVTFEGLDPHWDRENLGRSQVRVDEAIREYGALIDRGSCAPAPILWRNPASRRYDVLDGIQRLIAAEARHPKLFSAYIVDTDSAAITRRIRVLANYRLQGGYQESSEWTLERAVVALIVPGEMSVDELAEWGGWPLSAIRDKLQCVEFGLAIQGVGGPDKMPDSIVKVVAKFAAREDFAAAPMSVGSFCQDLQRMRLSAAEAEPYVEVFFAVARSKAKLQEQFDRRLREFRGDDYIAGRLADPSRTRYRPMTGEGKLLKSLKAAHTTATRVLESEESVPEMAEYFQLVAQLRKTLQQIDTKTRKRGR